MDKLIVSVATTGFFHGKEATEALPLTSHEIANSAYDCWNEGASIVHIHGRDENGLATDDPVVYEKTDRLIREKKCDIVIEHSMAPAYPFRGLDAGDVNDGVRTSTTKPPPEMVSLEVAPQTISLKDRVIPILWHRYWAERVAKGLVQKGIKPEIEIYNNSDLDDLEFLIERGVLKKPYFISLVLGMQRVNHQASRYSPKHLMHLVDFLPADSIFTVIGIGAFEFQAATLSILLGGNVRVGLEDNIYVEKGKLAESNAELVAKIVRIARELGCEIASPSEAREILAIPRLNW